MQERMGPYQPLTEDQIFDAIAEDDVGRLVADLRWHRGENERLRAALQFMEECWGQLAEGDA